MQYALAPICRWLFVVGAIAIWPPLAACADAPSPDSSPPEIEVELSSGRLLRATVDPRTDPSKLWLRFSRSAMGELTILRPIAWDRIARVRHAGADYSAHEFRPLAERLKQQTPQAVFRGAAAEPLPLSMVAAGSPPLWQPPTLAIFPVALTHLEVDAYVANWDGDVEVDGIVLHLFPMTPAGMAPISATVEVRLVGRRANPAEPSAPFPQIGRWTEQIVPEQLGPGGVVLRLPFQAVHPDFDFRVGPQGMLHVKLIAPSHGVFEASVADLRIRPYSGMRDRLQHEQNRRFFSGERTGREN